MSYFTGILNGLSTLHELSKRDSAATLDNLRKRAQGGTPAPRDDDWRSDPSLSVTEHEDRERREREAREGQAARERGGERFTNDLRADKVRDADGRIAGDDGDHFANLGVRPAVPDWLF